MAPSPNGSPYFKYPATPPEPPAPAMKPPSLPPVEYDRKYTGQLIVNKMNDYSLIRDLCKETVNAIACSYRSHEAVSGKPISCLIMLGPAAWNDDRALRHEIGHCNGWSDKHEGAR